MKTMKRLFPLFLALVMVLSSVVAVPLSVSAETPATTATATGADEKTAGYQEGLIVELNPAANETVTMTQYAAGSTSTAYISINSADELVLFSEIVNGIKATDADGDGKYDKSRASNSFNGKTVYLTQNIDMTGKAMLPIALRAVQASTAGTYVFGVAAAFTFDGQGYTIDNLVMVEEPSKVPFNGADEAANPGDADATFFALFGRLDTATVRNVVLGKGCSFTGVNTGDYGATSSLVASINNVAGKVENCKSSATVTTKTNGGAMVGRTESTPTTLKNLTFAGTMNGARNQAGGIVGYHYGTLIVDSCVNEGLVTGSATWTAGILGRCDGGEVVKNCINRGIVFSTANGAAGGIIGCGNNNVAITDCTNEGAVKTSYNSSATYLGGIVGCALKDKQGQANTATVTLTNCVHKGSFGFIAYQSNIDAFVGDTYVLTGVSAPTSDVAKANVAKNSTGVVLNNCLVAGGGYSEDAVIKVDLTNIPEITASTQSTDIASSTSWKIMDAAGLRRFSALTYGTCNVFDNKTIYLGADIDLAGEDFQVISSRISTNAPTHRFASGVIFDGQGYTISNMRINDSSSVSTGMFGIAYATRIRNVVLDASCSVRGTAGSGVASILGYCGAGTTVSNCYSAASVYGSHAAGITTAQNGRAFGCTFAGTVTGTNYVAGIMGTSDGAGSAINCVNYGTIISKGNGVAGIVSSGQGEARGGVFVTGCVNFGTVIKNHAGLGNVEPAAGIVYLANDLYATVIRNNVNYGTISHAHNNVPRKDAAAIILNKTQNYVVTEGNLDANDWIGYDANKIAKLEFGQYFKDITEVYEITGEGADRKVTLKNDATWAPYGVTISNAEGMRLLSALVFLNKDGLADRSFYLKNDIDMSSMAFNVLDYKFEEVDTFFPIGYAGRDTVIAKAATAGEDATKGTYTDTYTNAYTIRTYDDAQYAPEIIARFDAATEHTDYGKVNTYFRGNFDGQGYTVKNWTVDQSDVNMTSTGAAADSTGGTRIGLFGLTNSAVVQNVVLDETNKITNAGNNYRSRWTGFVVEAFGSTINNVWSAADWSNIPKNSAFSGGIAAWACYTSITNCTNDSDLNSIRAIGGIIGKAWGGCGISNCRNNGDISSTFYTKNYENQITSFARLGGAIGQADGYVHHVANVINAGKISSHGVIGGYINNNMQSPTEVKTFDGAFFGFVMDKRTSDAGVATAATATIYATNLIDYGSGLDNVAGSGGVTSALDDTNRNVTTAYGAVKASYDAMAAAMLTTRYQARTAAGATQDIRLIGTVDDADNYREAGFILTKEDGTTATVKTWTAYSSLLAAGAECTPENYGACTSQYFFILNIDEVPEAFTAQCYVVTMDGTILYGNVQNVPTPNVAD